MASRHEIVTIDFRANAAKANPAMDSLREAARDMRTEIEKTEAAIANGKATGMAQEELEKLGSTLTAQERKLRSFESAMASLSKGVGTLARAIDAFNAGTLQNMSAAFQKSSFNAAEAAKKALVPGTKDYEKNMAELDALQQKNLENLAKYKLRTEQMLKSIGEGGKISTTDLKQEADGIQELMKLLPHMGHEWQEYNHILTQINDAIKQQADAEKRLTGAIVDANDARQRSRQLTRDGADAAAREREAAEKEISLRNDNIASLKKEQEAKQRQVADSAAIVQAKEKEIEKARKGVAYAQQMIDNEEKTERALRKQIETLNTQADTFDKNANSIKGAVDAMKGEVDGLDAELKKVNADLEKMGPATQAAAKGGAAGGASKEAAADKKEEKQAVEEKAEADKKEEQAVKNKTKAKKEEKQAVKEKTEAKKEEIKADEKAAESEKKEELTTDQILKRQDELKAQLQELYKEKKDYARLQEQNAAAAKKEAEAVKEEANAYKDLTKEQAEAKLREKQLPLTTITKGEDGSFSFTNAEEAQHFIMDSIAKMGGYYNGKYSLSDKDKINQLLAQFGERYGVSGDDTVGAVRGLFKAGGYMSGGVMNPFIGRMEPEATEGYAAYAKDVKDLTAVIEGNTEAKKENIKVTEESAKAKRTEADIDKDIAEKEAESRRLTLILRKADSGAVEAIEKETEKNENLNASRKKSIELLKQTIEEYKTLSVEKAKAETDAMKAKSTVGYKGGRLDMSNPEEVQSWLIGQAKSISGKKGNGAISLEGGQVDKLLESFSKRYGWTSDTSTSKKLLKEIIQGEGGLFKGGGFADFSGGNLSVTIKQNADAIEKRNAKLQALTAISGGAAEGIEKVTDATKEDTDATKIWAKEVERRYQKYLSVQKEVDKLDEEIDKKRKRKRSLPKTGTDALLEREKISGEIETYKAENLYENKKNSADLLKKSWESSAKTLAEMMGLPAVEEVKQETAAENQNAEATEKAAKSKRGKKQAVKEAADAQKEEVKAGEEAVKQEEKLSEEEQKRQKLLEKKAELEGKIADKNSEITKKTEEAAGLEVKANNSRDEAKKKIDELTGAHERNERALKTSQGILENLEKTQDGYTKTLDKQRGELGEINKKIDENAEKRLEAEQKQAQAQKLTIDDMNEAVKVLEARNRAIEPEGKEWQENTRLIQQYKAEIDRLKNQPVLQMMTERMGSLKDLSTDALAETKKYWQQMVDGTERGNSKLAAYESNLKAVAEEERRRSLEVQAPMRERLNNLPNLSNADLAETKRYWQAMRDGLDQTTAAYKKAELAVKALENEEERRKVNAQAQHINDMMRDLNNLSTSGLAEVKRYWQAMADGAKHGSDEAKDAEKALKSINELENQRSEKQAGEVIGNMKNYSDTEISAAVKTFEQMRDAQAHGNDEWKRFNDLVKQGKQYLEELARTDTLEKMEANMKNLANLSDAALAETKKFWEAMKAGAEKGSDDLQKAEDRLKEIAELENKRSEQQARNVIGDMGSFSDKDISDAVKTLEQLRDAQTHGNDEWKDFNDLVQQGKQHLEELAKTDALAKMETNMANLATLSDAARAETKKFFETMKAGAEQGSEDLTKAKTHLEAIKDLEDLENKKKVQTILDSGSLSMFSESQIRDAIAAAKELQSHMASGGDDAKNLAESIANAEAHIKKFGIEAARTAKQQEESDRVMREQFSTMVDQWNQGIMPSSASIKAQQQYWQRLIDDPKTAKDSLQEYRDQLAEVEKMQSAMANVKGEYAFDWFKDGKDKDASTNKVKEMAADLKAYRDSLPRDTEAEKIRKIDEMLKNAGVSAKGAAEDVMELQKALDLAETAGKEGFLASPQEIQMATKALEKRREEVIKNIKANRDLGYATDDEEAELVDLTKKLRDLKFEQDNFNMSQEKMQMLMEAPKNAVNLDELRAAIKRADAELHRMEGSLGENSAEYKAFAEQVKNAKNVMKEMEGQAKANASAWEKAWNRLKTYVVMYMGFNAVLRRLMGTMSDLMELSDKMGEVRKTTGFTADEVGRLSDNLKKLDVRTPLTQLMEISAKAGQLGLKTEQDVMGFTEAANKLMIALPEMGAEAATEMMKVAIATGEVKKIQDQLNKGLVEGTSATEVALSKVGSVIDQLRANSAAAAPQITDFVKRVGAVGAQSGITIDQVAALGATVDALGMRVEMSATALSRMIPAIKNNAFDVANAIGMAPNALRAMFEEAGGGMEAILAIFQHIKDAGMDADSIEKLLGMGGLKDVMKELNQQGARAGIVFAGLSQNVDELRRNLGTAREAYEDNIAILQEYNKMNDTTAAKWERFKNQLEEFYIGDASQRVIGFVIDGLRAILDLLTGNNGVSAVLRTIGTFLIAVKLNIYGIIAGVKGWSLSLKNVAITIGLIDKETKKLQWGNIFTAAAAAILWVVLELSRLKSALDKANESLGKTKEEIGRAIDRFEGYWQKLVSTSEALQQAKTSHEKLSAEVDKLRKTTDGSAESTANLKKKEDELTASEKNVTRASNDHKSAIAQMNSIYGKYLGFILTEANYSNLAAAAHDKVTAAIEREMLMKQRQAAIGEVDSGYAQDIATGYGNLNERLVNYGKLSRSEAAKAMSDMQRFMRENMSYDSGTNKTVVSKAITDQLKKSGLDVSKADANEIAALWFDQYLKENFHLNEHVRSGLTGVERRQDFAEGWGSVFTPFSTNLRGGYADTYAKREKERGAVSAVYGVDIASAEEREGKSSTQLLQKLEKSAQDAKKVILDKNADDKKRNEAYGELANALEGLDNRINELDPQKDAETINRLNTLATSLKGEGIDIKKLKQAREKIHQTLFERATFNEEDIKNLDTTNPWGGSHEASSTDWKNMTAEQLVNRRKQMKEFVNAIQTDSDVKTVLAEDAALKKAIENGMSSDMRTVIEWYNTERLKIQDELHSRHLTNTGDWMDPKKSKARKKRLQDDMKAYLEELDAYYTERKAKIQEARNEEEISEAEAWNREIRNEAEWRRRRAELQKLYADKGVEVTKEEQDAIYDIIAERTEDDVKFIKATIGQTVKFSKAIRDANEQGAKEYRKFIADLNLGWEKDYLKQRNALGKHLKAIEDIVNKERPFSGIAKDMQDNLGKMGILTADLGDDAESAAEELKRVTFLLGEAENAYTMTVDKLLDDMRKKGFKEWADVIAKDPSMQQGMLAMLRQTFDSVQDAIKKESSIIKKQVEIMFEDINDQIMEDDTQLKILENSVRRANSLIGAGQASERVADKLAIKQIQLQITMQETRLRMFKKRGDDAVALLKQEADLLEKQGKMEEAKQKRMDAENVEKSVGLTLTKDQLELDKQRIELSEKLEESQYRLYQELRDWGNLFADSMREVMEASHAGEAEYFNELAKLNLTGKGGPGAGTYIVIDNEGTENARAHYEHLDERQALERQLEVERENAQAEAWKKVWEDINMKLSETITDQLNAMLQNHSIDANTDATLQNTNAIIGLTNEIDGKKAEAGTPAVAEIPQEDAQRWASNFLGAAGEGQATGSGQQYTFDPQEYGSTLMQNMMGAEMYEQLMSDSDKAAKKMKENNDKIAKSTKSSFAAMTAAANMYGIAFQTMTNENLSTAQKVEMMIVQAAGQALISMLTAQLAASQGQTAAESPSWISKTLSQLGPIAGPVAVGVFTALIGGLMGMAVSKISKSKSQISQVTGASASAGRLATGMLTYASGNVNEFTDPGTLTPGRQYNVDAADGRTYRARYMGSNPKTHLTNGPEFHLSGERGREMIIDAGTTRQITMNDNEIWHAIQTLSGGGRLSATRRRGRGVRAFADGNLDDFEEIESTISDGMNGGMGGFTSEQLTALQSGIDRQNDLLERALTEGIKGVFNVYGKGGLVDSYDTGKKTVTRHGERY